MAEALRDAMRIALRSDPTVFLLGEDIGVPKGFGGGFTVTLGLAEEFGRDRVMDTPISENAIVGAAVGAAMTGMRPIAEMQYGDFVFCAMDQVINQAAKMHYMSNGQVNVPLVLTLNKLMGFSVCYNDNDANANRESMIGSVDTQGHKDDQGYINASVFGSMRLVEAPAAP